MVVKKSLIALFVLAAPLAALQAQPTGTDSPAAQPAEEAAPAEAAAPEERRICRRMEITGQRTAVRRVCMTAAQWRESDRR